jgi:hypothetical protein
MTTALEKIIGAFLEMTEDERKMWRDVVVRSTWIDVDDDIPDTDESVLVRIVPWGGHLQFMPKDPMVVCAKYTPKFYSDDWHGDEFTLEEGAPDWMVTHWMRKPSAEIGD